MAEEKIVAAKPDPKTHRVMHHGQERVITYTSKEDLDKALASLSAEPEAKAKKEAKAPKTTDK